MPDDVFTVNDFVWAEDPPPVELDPLKMPPGSFAHTPPKEPHMSDTTPDVQTGDVEGDVNIEQPAPVEDEPAEDDD